MCLQHATAPVLATGDGNAVDASAVAREQEATHPQQDDETAAATAAAAAAASAAKTSNSGGGDGARSERVSNYSFSATAVRKGFEDLLRTKKVQERYEEGQQRLLQRELDKDVKSLQLDHGPAGVVTTVSPVDFTAVFFARDWMLVFSQQLIEVQKAVSLLPADSQIEWNEDVPEIVRQSVPGLGALEPKLQLRFLESCDQALQEAARIHRQSGVDESARQFRAREVFRQVADVKHTVSGCAKDTTVHALVATVLMLSSDVTTVWCGRQLFGVTKLDESVRREYDVRMLAVSARRVRRPLRMRFASTSRYKQMSMYEDAVARLGRLPDAKSGLPVWQHNARLLQGAVDCARAWLWEHAPDVVKWDDVVESMDVWIPEGLGKLQRTLLTQMVGTAICESPGPATNDVLFTGDDEVFPVEDPLSQQAAMERGCIRDMDLFTLTEASKVFTLPVRGMCTADTMLYGCKGSVGVGECVQQYIRFMKETLSWDEGATDDLLSMKLHRPGAGGAMGHYTYCMVDVRSMQLVVRHDGLKRDGFIDLERMSISDFEAMHDADTSVSQVRMIRRSARRMDVSLADLLSQLLVGGDSLEWTVFKTPMPLPPIPQVQSLPTCAFDSCIVELAVLAAVCIRSPVLWPESMTKQHWLQNQSFLSDGNPPEAGYLDFLRFEIMTAMCVARVACVGGMQWQGSIVDSGSGLPLCDVSEFVLGMGMPKGYHFRAYYFDEDPPTAVAARMIAEPVFKATKTEAQYQAEQALALQEVISKKTAQNVVNSGGGRTGRLDAVLERKQDFSVRATAALALAYSGQQDLSKEQWRQQLLLHTPDGDADELEEFGIAQAAKIMWVTDMSQAHPGMKTLCCFGGTRLTASKMQHKKDFEALPVKERPYDVVPLLKNLGRAMNAIAYEYFGPGTRDKEAELPEQSQVVVLLPFLRLVAITKAMQNLIWDECREFPEVKDSNIYILHMFQLRSDAGRQPVDTVNVDCRSGALQVLCAEYVMGDDSKWQVMYFTERIDEIQDGYYIDPFNAGPVQSLSALDHKFKLRGSLRAVVDGAKEAKFAGDILRGGKVSRDNQKTSATGLLRRQSTAPLSAIGSLTSAYSISEDAVNKSQVSDAETAAPEAVVAPPEDAVGPSPKHTKSSVKSKLKQAVTPSAPATPTKRGGSHANGADDVLICR